MGNLIPEDNLTRNKFKKISRACRIFANLHGELFKKNKGWRIDLVAVTINNEEEDSEISHYENIAFE